MFDPQHLGTFHVAYANETQRQSTGTTQVPGWIEMAGIVALPRVANLRTKQFRSCDPGRAVWRQYPSPDAADGVLTVPLKGIGIHLDSCVHNFIVLGEAYCVRTRKK